uniref:transposase n=1 Tax=Proteiniphilum sp. UBA5384 TaxID=1947279 RepID=UPI0025F2273D
MNQGKNIFAQLTDFLPRRLFDTIVTKHDGNKKIRSSTCWNQLLCMIFGQLTARDGMRDLMLSLEAHNRKYYHLGGKSVTRTNLHKANRNRDYRIYEEFALHTLYDIKTSIPSLVLITSAKVHDVNMLDALTYEAGVFYIMDKGYIDFTRLYKLNCSKAYFVTRAKENMQFRRIYSNKVD